MKKMLSSVLLASFLLTASTVQGFQDLPYATQITPSLDPEVWEVIGSFPVDDQDRITRLIREVDLSSFSEVFPVMRVYSVARFLRITAHFCFPEEGCPPKYQSVINIRPDSAEYYSAILLQKIGLQALIHRHVTFDEANHTMIWDPLVFVNHQN